MDDFTYSYPMKVYFGEDAAKKAFAAELGNYGKTVMLAYGGGSIKKSGIYEEMRTLLEEAGNRRSECTSRNIVCNYSTDHSVCNFPEADYRWCYSRCSERIMIWQKKQTDILR